jgi:hypothetical protein
MAILLMILGFIAWWPIGLLILAVLVAKGRLGYRRDPMLAMDGPMYHWGHCTDRWEGKLQKLQDKMDRVRDRMDRVRVPSGWRGEPRSSGNHAFDEYRAETLKRLEDEQREFHEFLDRLRFAKDKTEFDQFMAERRNRPVEPSPPPQG